MKAFALWICLFLCLPTALFSAQKVSIQTEPDTLRYQLVLSSPSDDRDFRMPVGGRIVCKDQGGRRYQGIIRGFSKDAIILKEEKVMMDDLVMIKFIPKRGKWRRIFGAVPKVVASIIFVVGTGDGITTYSRSPESYNFLETLSLIFSSLVLAVPIFLLGVWISKGTRIRFNLRRKYNWYMDVVQKFP